MMLHQALARHAEVAGPVRVAMLGIGSFTTMAAVQCSHVPGIALAGIAHPDPEKTRLALAAAGWPKEKSDALILCDDAEKLIASNVDLVIEATGDVALAVNHALLCLRKGKSLIMATSEADALLGPLLAKRFRDGGLVYSLPAGDQPALAAQLVDWARTCGFPTTAAGRGVRYLPSFHRSTPDTVWRNLNFSPAEIEGTGSRSLVLNALVDGTKAAVEMAQLANSAALGVQSSGLAFPPVGIGRLAEDMRSLADGGVLERDGVVEAVSCLNRDGSPVEDHLQHGVFVVVRAWDTATARRFREYGMTTDASGLWGVLWRPTHLFGLETGVSIASVGVLKTATGTPLDFAGDVASVAKRDLNPGDVLDGAGGCDVWGRLMPAQTSLAQKAFPIGLSKGARIVRAIPAGALLSWDDVRLDLDAAPCRLRLEMERIYRDDTLL